MTKKYNLALIPLSKKNEIIALAKKFSSLAHQYLLGEKSLPHVTLYQFHVEENVIPIISYNVSTFWQEKPIGLTFDKLSFTTSGNETFWMALLPDHQHKLQEMHALIASVLRYPIKKKFDPHMTLLNTKKTESEKEMYEYYKAYLPIIDTFILALGKSDEEGQLLEVIRTF